MDEFMAGAAAGICGLMVGHPMEVVKVQQQVQPGRSLGLVLAVQSVLNRGLTEGAFRGMALPLASFAAVNSLFFGVYGQAIDRLSELRPGCHQSNVALAGMTGGAAQVLVLTPVELIKTVMQAQLARTKCRSQLFSGPLHCALDIVRREGPLGLGRGFCLTFARDVPSYGLHMLLYDWLMRSISRHVTWDTGCVLLAGGITGSVSWLSVLPIDTVKSIAQAERRSGIEVARRLYSRHGAAVFYKGALVVTLRSFPVNAVTFCVWSHVLRLMKGSSSCS